MEMVQWLSEGAEVPLPEYLRLGDKLKSEGGNADSEVKLPQRTPWTLQDRPSRRYRNLQCLALDTPKLHLARQQTVGKRVEK